MNFEQLNKVLGIFQTYPTPVKDGSVCYTSGKKYKRKNNKWVEDKDYSPSADICGEEGIMIVQDEFNNGI